MTETPTYTPDWEKLNRAAAATLDLFHREIVRAGACSCDTGEAEAIVARVVAELARLDAVANERIAERPSGDLAAWYARGVRGAVRSMRIVAGLERPNESPFDQATRNLIGVIEAERAAEANQERPLPVCHEPDPTRPGWHCWRPLGHSSTICDFVPAETHDAYGTPITPPVTPTVDAQDLAVAIADLNRQRRGYSHGAA